MCSSVDEDHEGSSLCDYKWRRLLGGGPTVQTGEGEIVGTFLELPHGIPLHDTFGRVFARIKPEQFRK